MKKELYFFANFFLVLFLAAALLQVILFLQVDNQIYSFRMYPNWFLNFNGLALVSLVFLLKYLHFKQYHLSFVVLLITLLVNIATVYVVYQIITLNKEFNDLYFGSMLAYHGIYAIFSVSLIRSVAGERKWLRLFGWCALIFNIATIALLSWHLLSTNSPHQLLIQKLGNWIAFIGFTIPALLIKNFSDETRRVSRSQDILSIGKFTEVFIGFVCIGSLVITCFMGYQLYRDSFSVRHASLEIKLLAKQFEAREYTSNTGETLHYQFQKPMDYSADSTYPLLVVLHGGNGWGTDNQRQLSGIDHLFSSEKTRKEHPAFTFVPQLPPGYSWGGIDGLIPKDEVTFEAITALEGDFKIDTTRRYVVGHSLGGYGTWHFISTRPEMFAAALPFSGAGNPLLASRIAKIPVWAFHGALDKPVPVSGSRDMIEAMRKAGGNPRYSEFPDIGHDIWKTAEETPHLMDWLFEQKRK